jgi:predicted nucleic acid-binding protein
VSLVVDASVAVKWFFAKEELAAEALALLRQNLQIVAPDLVVAEGCNAAWKWLRLGRITPADLADIAIRLPRYFAELAGLATLAPRAAAIAAELDHPVYDCFYLALAEARHFPFVTADARLLSKLGASRWAASAVHLAQYRPSA